MEIQTNHSKCIDKNSTSDNIVDLFYHPKSVAVIGASKNSRKNGNHIVLNLISNGYKGKIYPVNPNYSEEDDVYNLKFKKSILDIDEEVEVVILYVANKLIPGIIKDCIKRNVRGIIIQTAGFEEVGEDGLALRDEIREITDNFSKIRIIGPNCMGISRIDGDKDKDNKGGFFCGFGIFNFYRRGNVALITQSGMLNSGYVRQIWENYPEMGFRYLASIGNKMDLGEVEFLEYFLEDSEVNVIMLYLESFKNPRKFIELARKAKRIPNKTILLLKGGSTTQGQNAAASHTGALAENTRLINAIIKQAGVIRANNFHELFQFGRTFSMIYREEYKMPKHGNVCSIIFSGGFGTTIADLASQYGITLPLLKKETYNKIESWFPPWMKPNKFALIDIFPASEYNAKKGMTDRSKFIDSIYDSLLKDPEIEGMIEVWFCSSEIEKGHWKRDVKPIINRLKKYAKPCFFLLLGDPLGKQQTSAELGSFNVPNFNNMEELMKNFSILVQETKNREKFTQYLSL